MRWECFRCCCTRVAIWKLDVKTMLLLISLFAFHQRETQIDWVVLQAIKLSQRSHQHTTDIDNNQRQEKETKNWERNNVRSLNSILILHYSCQLRRDFRMKKKNEKKNKKNLSSWMGIESWCEGVPKAKWQKLAMEESNVCLFHIDVNKEIGYLYRIFIFNLVYEYEVKLINAFNHWFEHERKKSKWGNEAIFIS